ncbi:MAG: arsenate reductase family protein [Actinomycetes bacterium]
MEIWVNPACSKCRSALSTFDDAGLPYTVRRYLDDPPTEAELDAVLTRLGLEPWDIARMNEPAAAEAGIADLPRDPANRDRWLAALAAHPILIQRPIITADDGTTVVGRTPESLQQVLDANDSADARE